MVTAAAAAAAATLSAPVALRLLSISDATPVSDAATRTLSFRRTHRLVHLRRRRAASFVVSALLPTANPKRAESGERVRWSARAVKAFAMAELEARKLKYPNTGTEALLMGILVEGTSEAAKFLRKNGITLLKVREETIKLLGKSDMYFFSPEHPPLTKFAQNALDWAVDEKLKAGGEDGEVTVAHLVLGIWAQKEAAGYKVLASLGLNDEKIEILVKSADEDVLAARR